MALNAMIISSRNANNLTDTNDKKHLIGNSFHTYVGIIDFPLSIAI